MTDPTNAAHRCECEWGDRDPLECQAAGRCLSKDSSSGPGIEPAVRVNEPASPPPGPDAAKQSRSRRKPRRAAQLGVTDEEYARMLTAQGGGCAICGAKPKTRRLHVDHDHASGAVRGLLCHRCNRALPTWVTERWLFKAAAYIGRTAA